MSDYNPGSPQGLTSVRTKPDPNTAPPAGSPLSPLRTETPAKCHGSSYSEVLDVAANFNTATEK